MNVDPLISEIEGAFSYWPISSELRGEIRSATDDPEIQELREMILASEDWKAIDDDWLMQFPLGLMSVGAFTYLLPALMRFIIRSELVDSVHVDWFISQFARLPKLNGSFCLRVSAEKYSKLQREVIAKTVEYLRSEMQDGSKRMIHHSDDIIRAFRSLEE